ncbi:hypothetical protein B0O80DRAFT_458709 [Mortierella sp. GBAus27b]|nr:hypothetical protein B0O80DRAFT_458709 [Mortierella sp. GBAus27b]
MFQTISGDGAMDQSKQDLSLPRDLPSFLDWRTMAGTIFADKTPYIKALEMESPKYRVVFLRPRRFGKSAFLNMFCVYYDIHSADIFNNLFGPLYIGKNPTPSKNSLLVLKFDLSSIDISQSFDMMVASFNQKINGVLRKFLLKYYSELGSLKEHDIINDNDASDSLQRLLDLVGTQNRLLFVGVDEYDAPVNNSAFPGGSIGLQEETLDDVQRMETFFKINFFSILKQGCSDVSTGGAGVVIDKYFLTGVTPAFRAGISPLTATTIVSHDSNLHGICGFTEDEVEAIAKHYLSMNDQEMESIMHSMRRLYSGYLFSDYADPPRLYNPHLVFHYISNLRREGSVEKPEESTAAHSRMILNSISDVGEFSAGDLLELTISNSVESKIKTEFGFSELLLVGKDREITWSFLFYLGILTRGPNGTLQIPNDVVKYDVLQRITAFLRAQVNINSLIVPAVEDLRAGRVDDLIKLRDLPPNRSGEVIGDSE